MDGGVKLFCLSRHSLRVCIVGVIIDTHLSLSGPMLDNRSTG